MIEGEKDPLQGYGGLNQHLMDQALLHQCQGDIQAFSCLLWDELEPKSLEERGVSKTEREE